MFIFWNQQTLRMRAQINSSDIFLGRSSVKSNYRISLCHAEIVEALLYSGVLLLTFSWNVRNIGDNLSCSSVILSA
jgi:hypothetical protein